MTRRIISYHKIQQDTDRIARIAVNVAVCRVFFAVDTKHCLPTARDRYRPPRQVSPAYRPPVNEPFCGGFSTSLGIAVGAVGILVCCIDAL